MLFDEPREVTSRQVVLFQQRIRDRRTFWQRFKADLHLLLYAYILIALAGAVAFYTIWVNVQ